MRTPDEIAALVALSAARDALERGDAAWAESRCRDALDLNAADASAWTLLGVILRRKAPDEARAALGEALERDPAQIDAYFHLGNLHREQGYSTAAIAAYERALALAPSHPSLLNNLALALQADGQSERAIENYRAALAARPGQRQALANLAHLLCGKRQYEAAAALCAEFVQRYPDAEPNVWIDWGICQHHARQYEQAEASFRRALALIPGDALTLTNLGSVLVDRGEFAQADEALTQAVESDPAQLYASSLLAYCRAHLCRWEGLRERQASIADQLESGSDAPVNTFAALSIPLSPDAQLKVAQRWARDLAPSDKLAPPANRSGGPARVGYVSSDFRTHATVSLLAEVWERHDRARLQTFAYSIGPREASPLRARVESAFDHFVDCYDESAEATAKRIRADGIDVLIDLNGYTTHARSEIFALRPCAVQISWLGYLGSLGAPWYDYILTDRFAAPPALQRCFTERFLYLPECYCPSDTRREVAPTPSRAACGLPESGLVLCCFNNSYKLLPEVFAVWMRLLAAAPGSVLWLSPDNPIAGGNLRREAQAQGIDAQRIVLAPRVSLPEHLARHAHADLFLDTTPYNAGTTANDALFMGLPLLTCAGSSLVSRVAGSQLRAAGLPELITTSLADYEALGRRLVGQPALLHEHRARLAANRSSSPLFDMPAFTRALDDLLLNAWENRGSVEIL
jgi:predicted O-linked N-acetylglucosamine transferase (SPINDLY family)